QSDRNRAPLAREFECLARTSTNRHVWVHQPLPRNRLHVSLTPPALAHRLHLVWWFEDSTTTGRGKNNGSQRKGAGLRHRHCGGFGKVSLRKRNTRQYASPRLRVESHKLGWGFSSQSRGLSAALLCLGRFVRRPTAGTSRHERAGPSVESVPQGPPCGETRPVTAPALDPGSASACKRATGDALTQNPALARPRPNKPGRPRPDRPGRPVTRRP